MRQSLKSLMIVALVGIVRGVGAVVRAECGNGIPGEFNNVPGLGLVEEECDNGEYNGLNVAYGINRTCMPSCEICENGWQVGNTCNKVGFSNFTYHCDGSNQEDQAPGIFPVSPIYRPLSATCVGTRLQASFQTYTCDYDRLELGLPEDGGVETTMLNGISICNPYTPPPPPPEFSFWKCGVGPSWVSV